MDSSKDSQKNKGKTQGKPRSLFRSIIWFLWEDNSVFSWLANVVVAFVLIKFVVYPLLALFFATTHPIVAVVSGSMEHNGLAFDDWWTQEEACCRRGECKTKEEAYAELNIDKEEFSDFPFKNGFNKGDLMVLFGRGGYDTGDVLVFRTASVNEPIIHRIVENEVIESDQLLTTRGDNNCASSPFEKRISKERFIGRAVLRIPYLGWVKIVFVDAINWIVGG